MNKNAVLFSLVGLLGLGARPAAAQLIVTAPVLETQSGIQTGLQNTMKVLSNQANRLVSQGVGEQELTKVFSEKNMLMAQNWYDGLLQVSSAVRGYRRVQSIFQKQTTIIATYSSAIEVLRQSAALRPDQLSGMTRVYGALLGQSAGTIGDLQTVVSPALFKMTDAERMKFIDQLDTRITRQLELVNYFTRKNMALMQAQQRQQRDQQAMQVLLRR